MQEALRGIRLKKTATKVSPPLQEALCADSATYYAMMEAASIEKYFERIRHATFPSFFLPCGPDVCRELRGAHQDFLASGRSEPSRYPALRALAERIEAGKLREAWPQVFVRLSTRSPKDAALSNARFRELFTASLAHLRLTEKDALQTEENLRLHALYVASTQALACDSGVDAMRLLIESPRIQEDLEGHFEMQLCIRRFAAFDVRNEFRAFVWDGHMTAATQYNHYVYFPRMVQQKNRISSALQRCFECDLAGKIPLDRYVIDFVLLEDDTCVIVEVNPLAEFAGMGLFDWMLDSDTIKNGPFELRVVQSPPQFSAKDIAPEWQAFLDLSGAE